MSKIIKIHFLVLLLLSLLLGCGKEVLEESPVEAGDFGLSFTVQGVDDGGSLEQIFSPKEEGNLRPSAIVEQKELLTPLLGVNELHTAIMSANGFDVMLSLRAISSNRKEMLSQETGSSQRGVSLFSTSAPLNDHIKYRLLIYNTDEEGNATSMVGQAGGEVGQETTVAVYRNKKYRWFAYSFNNTLDMPEINPVSAEVSVAASVDKDANPSDLLYATGLVSTSDVVNGLNTVRVNFERQTTIIRVELNARGLFSSISSAEVTLPGGVTGFKNGVFSLLTGEYVRVSNAGKFTNDVWASVQADSIPENWVKYRDFYTVANGAAMIIPVILTRLEVMSPRIVDVAPHTSVEISRSFSNVPFAFASFVPQSGKRYLASVRLIESAIAKAGAKWARGNLYYEPSVAGNTYRFRYDNPNIYNNNNGILNIRFTDYWNGGLLPQDGLVAGADPCAEVFPKGIWRLPTEMNYTDLIRANDVTRTTQPGNNGWFIHWIDAAPIGGGAPGHPNRNLKFTALGKRTIPSGVIADFNYESGNTAFWPFEVKYGDIGHYRTSNHLRFFVMHYRQNAFDNGIRLITESLDNLGAQIRCIRR